MGQEGNADGGIHAINDQNVRSVLWNTKKILGGVAI
jgi:hypothetical protein